VDSNFSTFTLETETGIGTGTETRAIPTERRPSLPNQTTPDFPPVHGDPSGSVPAAFTDFVTPPLSDESEQRAERAELTDLLQRTERDQPVDEMRLSYLLDKVSLISEITGPSSASPVASMPAIEDEDYLLAVRLQQEEEENARINERNSGTGRRSSGSAPPVVVSQQQPTTTREREPVAQNNNKGSGGCTLS